MLNMNTIAVLPQKRLKSWLTNPKYLMVYATIGIFLLIYLFGALLYGNKGFTTVRTFMLFFSDNAYIGISAVGMTLVLITGGIDLSVAAVASLTGMIIAFGTSVLGLHPLVCIAIALIFGVGLGALMGACIHYLNVPPFITTLTGMFFARGVCSLISRESISIKHDFIDALAQPQRSRRSPQQLGLDHVGLELLGGPPGGLVIDRVEKEALVPQAVEWGLAAVTDLQVGMVQVCLAALRVEAAQQAQDRVGLGQELQGVVDGRAAAVDGWKDIAGRKDQDAAHHTCQLGGRLSLTSILSNVQLWRAPAFRAHSAMWATPSSRLTGVCLPNSRSALL